MTGGRARGRGGSGLRGGSRGRGGSSNDGRTPNRSNGLDALTGGTVARRGTGRGNNGVAGTRGRGGASGTAGAKNAQERTSSTAPADGYTGIPYSPKYEQNPKSKWNTTPYEKHQYPERYAYLKHAQWFKKKDQISKGQMDPDGQMDMSLSVDKHGLCKYMCPELERVRRIVQNDVAGPEYTKETAHGPRNQRIPDESRMVSAHHRSSAGDELSLMTDLRTPETLLGSMQYMIKRLKDDSFEYLNSWIWDRSRAVRVEINKNYRRREDNEPFLSCYEMCIRFHVLSMHQMAKSKSKDYDRHTDWEQLSAACYQITQLWDKIKVYVPEDGVTPSPVESSRVAEIHAYNIILGLKERDHREQVRRDPRVRTAQTLVRAAQDTRNSTTFWRLVGSSQVSYLMACAAATRFNSVRQDTLEAMVKGYMVHKQKVDDWTLEKLVEILGFDDEDQVRTFCSAYGGEFETSPQGITHLRPETVTMRRDPPGLPRQFFSQKYVESKRGRRNLAAVLLGFNIMKAQSEGLLEPNSEREDSLFISDLPATSNPFAAAAQKSGQSSGLFPPTVQPGLFDASKNTIKFATPSNDASSSAPAPANPFASAATKLNVNGQSTTPTGGLQTSSTGFRAPTNATSFGVPTKTNVLGLPADGNPFGLSASTGTLSAPASTTSIGVSTPSSSVFPTSTAPMSGFSGFTFSASSNGLTGLPTSSGPPDGFSGFVTSNAPSAPSTAPATSTTAPSLSPFQASVNSPTQEEKRQAAEKEHQKAEEAQRKVREEEERKAQEERQRAAEERRRQAEEEQRRRVQEEQAKARVAEQQRRLREEQKREQLRIEQEMARKVEERRRHALESLTKSVMEDPKHGLMRQYIQNLVDSLAEETKAALQREQQAQDDALADEMWQRKRSNLTRLAFYKWIQHVHNKRRLAEARHLRERRRKLKAEIEAAKSSAASSAASSSAPEVQAIAPVPIDRPITGRANSLSNGISRPTRIQKTTSSTKKNVESTTQSNSDFSKSYYEARAQSKTYNKPLAIVDRTETDYFKLRAMGVDPSKIRKRSFSSVSNDEEEAPEVENKRARRSTSSALQQSTGFRQSLPPPATDEERMARFQAIKESLGKRGHGSSHSFDGARLFNGSTNQLIARARETLAQASPSRQSTPDAAFGRSTGTPYSNDRPAYWARQSRFVPQHLYGQPEAIRAYRAQITGRSPASSQHLEFSPDVQKVLDSPNFISSPIPTQPYQLSGRTEQFSETESLVAIDDDADGEDDGAGDVGECDGSGEDEADEEEQEYYSEDEEEGYSEEEDEEEEFAQKPGATEDDAIELSD